MILERLICREQSPCLPLQRGLEEYSLSLHPGASAPFRRHGKRLKSNLKSAECSKTVAGHLSNQVHEVTWASVTKGSQQPPGSHTKQATPGTLAANYFQGWEQAGLSLRARDPPSHRPLKATQGPGDFWSQEDSSTDTASPLHRPEPGSLP